MTATEHQEDARTVARALAGDELARERVAERALTIALRTAVALLGDREHAADVAQDVALVSVTRLKKLRDPVAFRAWVTRTTMRECAKAHRRRQRDQEQQGPLELLATEPVVSATAMHNIEVRLAIADRLAELPRRQRAAVVLRYVHDLTDEEIAVALSCRVGTVHSLLSRSRAALREDPLVRRTFSTHAGETS